LGNATKAIGVTERVMRENAGRRLNLIEQETTEETKARREMNGDRESIRHPFQKGFELD
jgi:hypothetical protein